MGIDHDDDMTAAATTHRRRIYRYLLGMTRDPDTADDLTQETFLRAVRASGSLRDPDALLSWLYRLATNVFLDRVRADRRLARVAWERGVDDEIATAPAPGPGPDRLAERADMSACVRGYLDRLPDSYRAVIILHDAYGLTDHEVAEGLGVSLGAAKVRIHRARARLRSALASGCRFETDDRGILVCDPVARQPDCGPDCPCHTEARLSM